MDSHTLVYTLPGAHGSGTLHNVGYATNVKSTLE